MIMLTVFFGIGQLLSKFANGVNKDADGFDCSTIVDK